MAQHSVDNTTRRFVHPNGTVSNFLIRDGVVGLVSVHPEHVGNPTTLTRDEFLAVWDRVTAEATAAERNEVDEAQSSKVDGRPAWR